MRVFGDSLPATILGKGHIICASLRNLYAASRILANWVDEPYDVVFIDQLSISIPLFLLADTKVYFYCHFPDMLLAQRGSLLKRFYRVPFDALEQVTTGMSTNLNIIAQACRHWFLLPIPSLHRPIHRCFRRDRGQLPVHGLCLCAHVRETARGGSEAQGSLPQHRLWCL